ncbi:acetyltransferase [Hazenella sp. IB182357]|uniref:Lysine N-acyltransferase MbtK n=1 Tax=Polycladospora coralii TaxID=2771432 RepID=A0A926RTM3_9BACL|nr:GNAT family N-acetyltransferase [Polycladospora coralii]MBD1371878.1 acetyltransferase [Polycladospora coralii]MBS7529339.1 acetyltransferase [Polycladospora coralii]
MQPLSTQKIWKRYEEQIKKEISFRPVELDLDVKRLHSWMQEPHVIPFWKLNIPFADYEIHLQKFLADHHQSLHIGQLDGRPMSYWETYWVQDDLLGQHYDFHPEDQGVHLLIGPPSYLGKGYAAPLLRHITYHLFQHESTQKVVAEPDIRNEKMIHVFQKCGFEFQRSIQLPDKEAALMFCEREPFMRSWKQDDAGK